MNQRQIGIVLIIVAVLMAYFTYSMHQRNEYNIMLYESQAGSCFLEDGTCLHQESQPQLILGWAIAGALFLFGLYLAIFDKTQAALAQHQLVLSKALEAAASQERSKDEFSAYLAAFSDDEQKVLKAIREQEGITQSTLRYRTGMSKTQLSLLLKNLESRKVVSRKDHGKTKALFLIKKF